jgi:uncharacterized membrane protein YfcA
MFVSVVLVLLAGALAGFLGGLLGIGGGLPVVAALSVVLPTLGVPGSAVLHVAVATSLAAMVLTFVSSATAHIRRGSVLWATWKRIAPGMVIGALVGTRLAARLPEEALRGVIAVFCLVMAGQMGFRGERVRPVTDGEQVPRSPWLIGAGVGIGALSSAVGIGGGSMTVPLLVSLSAKPVRAVGTSALCGLMLALVSTLSYALAASVPSRSLPWGTVGYVSLPVAALIAVGSMSMAPVGVRVAHRLSGTALKRVFALFLIVMGALIALGG